MATTTTSKIAEAISLLSDALSTEVAASQQFSDDEDEASVPAQTHEELKTLVEDFAAENLSGLEEVQSDLQVAVGDDADEDDEDLFATASWSYGTDADEDDDDDAAEDEETDADDTDADDSADDDETQPTDEEKVDMLIAAGDELQEQIDEHENTIEDLKNTIKGSLGIINELVSSAESFHSQSEEF